MDVNLLREAVTVLSFAAFMGVVAYAVHPRNGKRFDEAARHVLDDDDITPHPGPLPEGRGRKA